MLTKWLNIKISWIKKTGLIESNPDYLVKKSIAQQIISIAGIDHLRRKGVSLEEQTASLSKMVRIM